MAQLAPLPHSVNNHSKDGMNFLANPIVKSIYFVLTVSLCFSARPSTGLDYSFWVKVHYHDLWVSDRGKF